MKSNVQARLDRKSQLALDELVHRLESIDKTADARYVQLLSLFPLRDSPFTPRHPARW